VTSHPEFYRRPNLLFMALFAVLGWVLIAGIIKLAWDVSHFIAAWFTA